MKIYTRTGDAGETGLWGGGRVPKDHVRVAAYGQVDEVNAVIGLARALEPREFGEGALLRIQGDLFTIGAELAQAPARSGAAVAGPEVAALEDAIDSHEAKLAPLRNFILPGGTPKAAAFHLARTVCRRAERAVVTLSHQETVNPAILQYLNRLSDLLFVLARAANAAAGHADVQW